MNSVGSPSFFELDKNRLDMEWARQPGLYHEYALILADARKEHEQAKADKELVEAEQSKKIRENPESFGLERVTEAGLEKAVGLTREYRAVVKRVIDAKHAVDVAEAVVWTLEHRKKALENLVTLRMADYYSEPRGPKGVSRDQLDSAKRRNKDA